MKVARKVQFKTNEICVGDQITVRLSGFGKFTATAQRVTDKGILFLFDEVIARHPMNETNVVYGLRTSRMLCSSLTANWIDTQKKTAGALTPI